MESEHQSIEQLQEPNSPRFNEKLPIKYILINTHFTERALTSSTQMDHLQEFSNMLNDSNEKGLEIPFFHDNTSNISNIPQSDIKIVKNYDHSRLLYTFEDDVVSANGNPVTEVNDVRTLFAKNGINDRGSFVFEINHQNPLTPLDIVHLFDSSVTQMSFCACICISCLFTVTFYPSVGAIEFIFDTESG